MADLIQLAIYGLVYGSILTLGAIGVSLIFGIMRFAHFAHGDQMTVGAYVALALVGAGGLPLVLAAPLAVAAGAGVAVAIDQVLYRRLRRAAPVILLISSFGVALVLRSAVQVIWGPGNAVYAPGIEVPLRFLDFRIQPSQLYILAASGGLVTALHLFLRYTRTGKAMRAMSDDPDLARITGIDTERVIMWTWAIGGGMAAAAGIFLGADTRLNPLMGWHTLLPIFAAAILGGIGRPYGAIAGGMMIGVAAEVSTAFIEPVYKPAVAFAIMVVMLVARPTGLFRGQ